MKPGQAQMRILQCSVKSCFPKSLSPLENATQKGKGRGWRRGRGRGREGSACEQLISDGQCPSERHLKRNRSWMQAPYSCLIFNCTQASSQNRCLPISPHKGLRTQDPADGSWLQTKAQWPMARRLNGLSLGLLGNVPTAEAVAFGQVATSEVNTLDGFLPE